MDIKRKKHIILSLVIIFLLCSIVIISYAAPYIRNSLRSVEKVYETNWNIAFPPNMKLLYDKKTSSFHGDGMRHTIYSVSKTEEYFLSFSNISNDELEKSCLGISSDLEDKQSYVPDFELEYVWKKYKKYSNTLIIVYFIEENELHLFQQLM